MSHNPRHSQLPPVSRDMTHEKKWEWGLGASTTPEHESESGKASGFPSTWTNEIPAAAGQNKFQNKK